MNKRCCLELEILSGPLDGYVLLLETITEFTRKPGSLLSFPWDEGISEPQARFIPYTAEWQLEGGNTKRGTHLLRQEQEVSLPVVLQVGDVVKASNTWMRIKNIT